MSAVAAIGEGLFEIGLDAGGDALRAGYGGDAPNAAVMAALAGAEARIGGRVGDDAFGRLLLAFWRERGVDTSFVRVDETAPTGIYVNEATPAGHRFDYHRTGSAGSRLAPGDLDGGLLADVAVVHLTGITLTVAPDAARAAIARAPRLSFAVNHRPRLSPDADVLLAAARVADVVFVSDEEGEALLGEREPERIAAALGGEAEELVVTTGSRGASVLAGGAWAEVSAPAVEVVDAAGAGDALAGCYLAERVRASEPAEALRVAVAAASLSCTRRGCAASYPDRAALDAFLRGLR
ncbi:MAG TPA: PfkB family carbohydrate kinase [Gaiellaceae bacterium]|nr:PfkB family carbohydrate kinase [Gaiellaceae bacterium]